MLGRRSVAVAFALLLAGAAADGVSAQAQVPVEMGARDPAISPDGSTVALSILGKIWTLPFEGGAATQLSHGPSWDTRPAWSPDGGFIAYSSRGAAGTDLIVLNLATGGTRYLHRTNGSIGHTAFSPDGDHVYFVDERSQYDAHVWRLPVQGGEAEQLTATQNWHEWSFAIAPDEARLLLESGRYGGADLYELELESGSVTRLTETAAREMSVALSQDGRSRAHVETHNGVDHIVVATDGGPPRRVHTSPFDQKQLAFHPKQNVLVVTAGRRLHKLRLDGGEMSPIPFEARFVVAGDPPDDLAITNVRLFAATSDDVIPNATVLVRDGRILRVLTGGSADGGDLPPGTPSIDGRGRTLLPGLFDNHLHFWGPSAGADLLAAGVTTIRDPGSAMSDVLDYKDAIRLGILAGPTVFAAGPLIDGPGGYHPMVDISIEDPAAAAPLVRAMKAQGVDFLKAYFQLDPNVLAAVVAEAKVQGLPVTGHIGVRTSWREAMDAGIAGFNHIRIWKDFLPEELQVDGRNESLDSRVNLIGRMQLDWRLIDPEGPEASALIDKLAATGTAIDPTLYVQYFDESARSQLSLEQYALATQAYEQMGTFVRRAVEAGVPLLAGTDNVGLFNELEAYEKAGVPNAEILRAATVNGARWFGEEDDFGTIQAGMRAHMILVDGDPLADMSQLRNIDLVVKDGVIVFAR